MEITKEMSAQIDQNIEKIIAWLLENRHETEAVYADYNPNKNPFGQRKFDDTIGVTSKGEVVSFNLWGYHSVYQNPMDLYPHEKMEILEQWSEIKARFLEEKAKIIAKNSATLDTIFKFEI